MASVTPSPTTWTVRFKYHKTIVLLHLDSQTTIQDIKKELLEALRQTCSEGSIAGQSLPESWDDIELARPINHPDHSVTWKLLTLDGASNGNANGLSAKGKGKQRASTNGAVQGLDAESLSSLGFKDNAMLAFRFTSDPSASAAASRKRKLDDEDDDVDVLDADEAEEWDVVLPSWDDADAAEDGIEVPNID